MRINALSVTCCTTISQKVGFLSHSRRLAISIGMSVNMSTAVAPHTRQGFMVGQPILQAASLANIACRNSRLAMAKAISASMAVAAIITAARTASIRNHLLSSSGSRPASAKIAERGPLPKIEAALNPAAEGGLTKAAYSPMLCTDLQVGALTRVPQGSHGSLPRGFLVFMSQYI